MNLNKYNKISFKKYFFLIFFPLIFGFFFNDFFYNLLKFKNIDVNFSFNNFNYKLSEFIITAVNILILIYLYNRFIFQSNNKKKKKLLILYTFLSFFLTIVGSYFFFIFEGFKNFYQIKNFEELGYYSDISGMARLIDSYQKIPFDISEFEIIVSGLIFDHYNNYLSPLKIIASIKSLPLFGFYSLAIYSYWYQLIFFSILLTFFKNNYFNNRYNFILFFLLIFIVAPFALPNDRESIIFPFLIICATSIISINCNRFKELLKILICFIIFYLHRPAYLLLLFFLFLVIFFFINKNLTKKKTHDYILINISFILILFILLIFFGKFSEFLISNFHLPNHYFSGKQDNWNNLKINYPSIFYVIKFFFLILAPFPYFQIFKDSVNGWSLIVPSRLISLNIFPIFMLGKLFIFILALKIFIKFNYKYLIILTISVCFFLSPVISLRSGQYYLLPSYVFLVFWILINETSSFDVIKSVKYYIYVVFVTHFFYIFFYNLN
jgi:hypothetical protein